MEALASAITKLGELLVGEYNLQKEVKGGVEFLQSELGSIQGALEKISSTPADQLDKQDKIWARDVRELAYDIEDKIDTFMVRCKSIKPANQHGLKKVIDKSLDLLRQPMIRHKIALDIRDIKCRVNEVSKRHDRYKVGTINPMATVFDPRITNLYTNAIDLVGINTAVDELVDKLIKRDNLSMQQQWIVSIVGFGGLGKTTLAKAVYDKIKLQFDCTAFVTVSRNPEMKKILKDLLYDLDQREYGNIHNVSLDEKQLIDIARGFLHDKRYLVVIDDLWNTSDWDMIIKYALPDNNNGSRIITTTRKITIANHIGCSYEMHSLSLDNSRVLLYRRIFGIEDIGKCLDEDLAKLLDRILKKCAGVPLAIITIAGLLASRRRNKIEWDEVYNSIGDGTDNSLDAGNMRKILAYSYYDLPSHLRTCLLYLSVFPEDSEIDKDRLIWLWIADGFMQHEKQWKKSLFELGESYFNELINRSLIQPIYYYYYPEIMHCRVHDMVLDLICSISTEENFVTTLRNEASPSTMVRRLSLRNGKTDCVMTQPTWNMSFVRSVIVFPSALDQMPALRNFKVLRVLDLQGCDLSQGCSLLDLGSLFHLRYLSLKSTQIDQLPEAVGNLQFLEILDVSNNRIIGQLPKCVAHLKRLLCLTVDSNIRVSNGIGNLTSLEELSRLSIDKEFTDNIYGLGLLRDLRVLRIVLLTDKWTDKIMESVCKLRKIKRLSIDTYVLASQRNMGGLDAWVPSPQLCTLDTRSVCWFSALPAWMSNPTHFHELAYLSIAVRELQQEDIGILGRLPALRYLFLEVDYKGLGIIGRSFIVGAGLFPCLLRCLLAGSLRPVMFQQGTMPRLRDLDFKFHVSEEREIAGSSGRYDCGLGNLPSLKNIFVWFKGSASKEEVEEAKAAVRHAAAIHPNQPRLHIF